MRSWGAKEMNYGPEASTIDELRKLGASFKKNVRAPRKPRRLTNCMKLKPISKISIGKKIVRDKLTTNDGKKVGRKLKIIENPNLHRENCSFVVTGKPVGYYSLGSKPNFKRMNQYHKYKRHVEDCAKQSGIKLPLVAGEKYPVEINTKPYYQTRVHADSENVRKGIVDSLFYNKERKGLGDKYCFGKHEMPNYDKDNPHVLVEIIFHNL